MGDGTLGIGAPTLFFYGVYKMKKLFLIPIVLIIVGISYKIHYRFIDIETTQNVIINREGKKNDGSIIIRKKTPYEERLFFEKLFYSGNSEYVGNNAGDFGR